MGQYRTFSILFDHFVGLREQRGQAVGAPLKTAKKSRRLIAAPKGEDTAIAQA
jgi:hypothetical protein